MFLDIDFEKSNIVGIAEDQDSLFQCHHLRKWRPRRRFAYGDYSPSSASELAAHRRLCRVAAADLLQLRRDVDLPHASLAEAPSLCLHQRAEATLLPSLPQAGEVAALHCRKGESGEV